MLIKPFKIKPTYCLLLTSALVLSACALEELTPMGSGGKKVETAEDLLAAEGEWKLVEEQRPKNPLQKHMDSRDQVVPWKTSGSRDYTESAKSMHVDEDIHFRVLRLERQMDTVRSDLDKIVPKLAMVENKPVAVAAKTKVAATPAKKAMAVTKPKMEAKTVKSSVGGALRVMKVRHGVHPDKFRLVLDMSKTPKFTYDLDNTEGLLIVEMPATGWSAPMSKSFGNHPVVKSYNAQIDGSTARMMIELKSPAKVTMAKAFKPNHVHGDRLVLDIAAQ